MLKKMTLIAASAFVVTGLMGCEVEKTQEGHLTVPKYEVEKTQEGSVKVPEYNVETPDVAVNAEERTVTVPTVKTEERVVTVPKVEVTPASEK
ncbi:MAG: hypothetical protein K0S28_2308 [Paucimonas sp.]|jgi:hypothetical protein|nr:hypothetical protein [Paucimonas sp.]